MDFSQNYGKMNCYHLANSDMIPRTF